MKGGGSPTSSSRSASRAFVARVAATIASRKLLVHRQTVLVGLSGGADSTALLHVLCRLRERLRTHIAACHVHHGLRGEEADEDARHAAAFAASLGVPFVEKRAEVRAYATEHKLSIEAAARTLRYARLEEAADELEASRIATGHTADDQAETVLLNLLRGAGPLGLSGIAPVRGRIVRPLLDVTRADVEAYCRVQGLGFRLDRSNLDRRFTRNRLRLDVIPLLRELQPGVVSALCRLADVMRGENEYLASQVDWLEREVVRQEADRVLIALDTLVASPLAMQRRVVRRAIARLRGDESDLDLERIEAVVQLATAGRTGSVVELPGGVRAERIYSDVVITAAPPEGPVQGQWSLPVPGAVVVPEAGVEIAAEYAEDLAVTEAPDVALLDADKVALPLLVRTWRPGDRFTPLGMNEPVKLQDFFVNAKVPRAARSRALLVESAGRIVWLVGLRISEEGKVTEATRRTIRLRVCPIGTSPGE